MTRFLLAGLLASTATFATAEAVKFDATLAGHAVLPAETLIAAPADAPQALQTSGKFTGEGNRRSHAAPTDGAALPFNGQPLQGFSGIKTKGDGSFYVLTDNGFGSKVNSPDAMLFFSVVRPDFATGAVDVVKTTFLSDPNGVVPFPIVMEGSETRYLTGADFDIEGFQMVGDEIVIGDEFGPFVMVFDRETGVMTEFHETRVDGATVMSPDNPFLRLGNPGSDAPAIMPSARAAMRALRPRSTAPRSTRCWKARSGPATPMRPSKMAAPRCASSKWTPRPATGPAPPGSTRWKAKTTRSAIST